MANYSEIIDLVNKLYDSYESNIDSDPAARASDSALSDCGINNVINNVSTFSPVTSLNGSIRGYQYMSSIPSSPNNTESTPTDFDSTSYRPYGTSASRRTSSGRGDIPHGGYRGNNTVSVPVTKTGPLSAITNALHSGVEYVKDSVATVKRALGSVTGAAWAAIGALAKFGFDTNTKFYGNDPDIWENIVKDGKKLYPDDYASIFTEDQNGRSLLNDFYLVDSSGNITHYLPEDALAFLYRSMRDKGLLNKSTSITPSSEFPYDIPRAAAINTVTDPKNDRKWIITGGNCVIFSRNDDKSYPILLAFSISPTSFRYQYYSKVSKNTIKTDSTTQGTPYTYKNKTVYYRGEWASPFDYSEIGSVVTIPYQIGSVDISYGLIAWAYAYGSVSSTTPGVSPNSDSTYIDPSVITGTTIPQISQQLTQNYPEVFGSPVTVSMMDDSCNEFNINYHPVTIPLNIGVGDIFPVSISPLISGSINPSFNPQINPTINPNFNVNPNFEINPNFDTGVGIPSISIDPSVSISPDVSLPDINLDNILDHLFDIMAEILQGAPGGGGISLDPNVNITINNYNEQPEPTPGPDPSPYPDKPDLPQINVNPPTVNVNVNVDGGDGGSGGEYPPIKVEMPNISLPDPTFPIIIPPWPTNPEPSPAASEPEGWPTAMWHVYNPTQGQINSFGAWLWSPDFVDTIKRMFESPIDSVFSLHKVYCQPNTSGESNIVVGSLNSGVPSRVVSSQYTYIDCGDIQLDEYFGNVFDYAPYTVLNLYLPFIGIVELDPAYCMRSEISIFYTVDVFTGACVAKVGCKRDGIDVCVYEYSGSASLDYPVSAGSYSSIMQGVLSGAVSALAGGIGTYLTGNPMPAVYGASGAIQSAMHGRAEIRHSGSFAGAAGAMGIRKPYLIISRPIIALAEDFAHFDGYPANSTVYVSECKGYIKCKECHLNIPTAYQSELEEIDNYFKSGVII